MRQTFPIALLYFSAHWVLVFLWLLLSLRSNRSRQRVAACVAENQHLSPPSPRAQSNSLAFSYKHTRVYLSPSICLLLINSWGWISCCNRSTAACSN